MAVAAQFHFISGLPRAGAALLTAILNQNPRFHAGVGGPVAGMYAALLDEMGGRNESAMLISDVQRERVLRGLFEQYYADAPAGGVVFDAHRSWCSRLRSIKTLFPGAKMIACVRDISWIVDSIERVVRVNAFQPSPSFNYPSGGTVYSRCEALTTGDGMVAHAYNALREAFYGEDSDSLLLLQYETLVEHPRQAMQAVYDFIGEAAFEHEFTDIQFDMSELDRHVGTPGLHRVHPTIRSRSRPSVLPPDLMHRFDQDAFWTNQAVNLRQVRIV
ncbi:sulfotransferase [Frateuria aurantia]|uniref:Sulfotransferase family protein n=1 Tax=Frateuria aurantia (strain ATCC 33424 / DSM 6220 / KCTC 2777 / LMG 1558 / NBRC 3245 / NCIMB 13370) TaxID=767434 RepID=H8L416_FRAAD|nr:sulfotransferase family protein [Frateuria aurantia DSM 6220]